VTEVCRILGYCAEDESNRSDVGTARKKSYNIDLVGRRRQSLTNDPCPTFDPFPRPPLSGNAANTPFGLRTHDWAATYAIAAVASERAVRDLAIWYGSRGIITGKRKGGGEGTDSAPRSTAEVRDGQSLRPNDILRLAMRKILVSWGRGDRDSIPLPAPGERTSPEPRGTRSKYRWDCETSRCPVASPVMGLSGTCLLDRYRRSVPSKDD